MRQVKGFALRTRSKSARLKWSRNATAKRERLRLDRCEQEEASLEREYLESTKALQPDAIISIRFPKINEARIFRVHRDGKKFLAMGRMQAASTIGKRITLALENLTA